MTDEMAESLATCCLQATRYRMEFSECYHEAVRNVAAAIQAAAKQAEIDALSFKTVDTEEVANGGYAWPT